MKLLLRDIYVLASQSLNAIMIRTIFHRHKIFIFSRLRRLAVIALRLYNILSMPAQLYLLFQDCVTCNIRAASVSRNHEMNSYANYSYLACAVVLGTNRVTSR